MAKIRRLQGKETRALFSDVFSSGSDAAIAGHLATILRDPATFEDGEFANLVEDPIHRTSTSNAKPQCDER